MEQQSFSPDWWTTLENTRTDELEAFGSVASVRNNISHGGDGGMTMATVKQYFDQISVVLDDLSDIFDPLSFASRPRGASLSRPPPQGPRSPRPRPAPSGVSGGRRRPPPGAAPGVPSSVCRSGVPAPVRRCAGRCLRGVLVSPGCGGPSLPLRGRDCRGRDVCLGRPPDDSAPAHSWRTAQIPERENPI